MTDNKIYTLGLIPIITQDDLDKLNDEGRAVITRELAKVEGKLTHQEDLTPVQIRDLMEALDVSPIWGRDGMVIYRLSIAGKILVFGLFPDVEKDLVHPDILDRQFIACESIEDLVEKMLKATLSYHVDTGHNAELLPEDHPEESAIGFICPQLNTVWLLNTEVVGQNLKDGATGPWAQVPHLIQSNQGRLAMAFMIAQGKLQTQMEFMEQVAGLNALTPQPTQLARRQQEGIVIDLLSGKIAERYKERYMGKKQEDQ